MESIAIIIDYLSFNNLVLIIKINYSCQKTFITICYSLLILYAYNPLKI